MCEPGGETFGDVLIRTWQVRGGSWLLRVTSGRAKCPGGFLEISPPKETLETLFQTFPEDASRLISEHNPPTHPHPQAHPSKKHSGKPQRAFSNRRTFASIQLDSGC